MNLAVSVVLLLLLLNNLTVVIPDNEAYKLERIRASSGRLVGH
jgi:hypothetical protein